MNILKTLRLHPVLTGALAVIASVGLFAGVMHAWGPTDRATFTEQSPAPYVTFDSITNNSNYGDERNFSIVKDAASTSPTDWKDTLTVEAGKEYLVRIYVHNNAASNLNLVAENTRASVNLPTETAKSIEINSFISADNANPQKIWDQVTLTSDKNFNLAYVPGSAKYTNNLYPQGTPLGEDLFTSPGALLGYDKLDGKIPGCFQYSGYVTFKVKPQFAETPDFTMSKQVRKHSDTTGGWNKTYATQPGETVDYLIQYKNDAQTTTMNNVVVKDALPAGVTYIPGSTVLANGNFPTGKTASDNIATTNGLNIGSYAPGASAWVRFSAKVADNDSLSVCGTNTLVNTATVISDYGTKTDTATVTTAKTCSTPVDNDVTVCNVQTGKIVTIKESEKNANPSNYADKDSEKCKTKPVETTVTVCNITTGVVETINQSTYDQNPSNYADKDSEKCKVPATPVTPETPATPSAPAELPKTGASQNILSFLGVGTLTYVTYAYIASRRALAK